MVSVGRELYFLGGEKKKKIGKLMHLFFQVNTICTRTLNLQWYPAEQK